MAIGPRLDLRQSQSLVMTPQLQQAIRLLALSNLEIESFIAEELEKNPLLDTGSDEASDRNAAEADEVTDTGEEPATVDRLVTEGDGARDAPLDMDLNNENLHQDSASDRALDGGLGLDHGSGGGGGEEVDYDSFAGEDISLHDHLLAQAGQHLSGTDLVIAAQIVEQIEETGYFPGSTLEIANRLGTPLQDVERVLAVIQTFDPSGVGARTLAECIAIQAKEADRYDPAMALLIDNLDHVAKGNRSALKRICDVDDEDLSDMLRELRGYDPKPGCKFAQGSRIDAVVPDIFIGRRGQGWAIELNSATLPRLLVNRTYYAELAEGAQDRKSKTWLSECLASANWLMKALDQRARTIVKVATEIVQQQDGFFRHGVAHLKPLTLRTVADAIGMHESTVSRVTSNKYLSCDRGLFELKYFFTSGVQSSDGGDAVSAEAVKSHIRALVAAEDPAKILSDDQIVDMLRAKGFDIARRTVAKYREAAGIGSSVQRRRQKAIGNRAA
ncbi:RNA polymerase factor sigma-54 [Sphingosinicella rhizophila]|uniref:RNA polymerase sigma-54 factor n=1 Tax=Sphingosinicella rhizophila TaxID=3050082 RepID=A0ABU3Q7U3_9SPHN|nr:RNA polymerase factor sigma-54 [Sphingosinicella sp. GR2756]MDT9599446.1 RNA polymerase factor sigma-54 [Sphingosinicella sp. GR2756]